MCSGISCSRSDGWQAWRPRQLRMPRRGRGGAAALARRLRRFSRAARSAAQRADRPGASSSSSSGTRSQRSGCSALASTASLSPAAAPRSLPASTIMCSIITDAGDLVRPQPHLHLRQCSRSASKRIAGFFLGLLFWDSDRLPGRRVALTLLFAPMVVTPVAAGTFWRLIYDPTFGVLDWFITLLVGFPRSDFLSDANLAFCGRAGGRYLDVDAVHGADGDGGAWLGAARPNLRPLRSTG